MLRSPFATPTPNLQERPGFSLVELLVCVTIIGIIAAMVFVAINPNKQLGESRNTKRRSDVNGIANAVMQYAIDFGGTMPCASDGSCVDGTWRMLGGATEGCDMDATCGVSGLPSACLRLSSLAPVYLADVPGDPRYGSGSGAADNSKTMYVVQHQNYRVRVQACYIESGEFIVAER